MEIKKLLRVWPHPRRHKCRGYAHPYYRIILLNPIIEGPPLAGARLYFSPGGLNEHA